MRFTLVIFLTSVILPCKAQTSLLQKYSGAYNMMVTGYSGQASEAYSLKPDGPALWVYGWRDSAGRVQTQQKKGTWIARDGEITTTINGITGKITEVYRLKGR